MDLTLFCVYSALILHILGELGMSSCVSVRSAEVGDRWWMLVGYVGDGD